MLKFGAEHKSTSNLVAAQREHREDIFWERLFPLWFEHFPEHLTGRFRLFASDEAALEIAIRMRKELVRNDINAMMYSNLPVPAILRGYYDWREEMDLELWDETTKPKVEKRFEDGIPKSSWPELPSWIKRPPGRSRPQMRSDHIGTFFVYDTLDAAQAWPRINVPGVLSSAPVPQYPPAAQNQDSDDVLLPNDSDIELPSLTADSEETPAEGNLTQCPSGIQVKLKAKRYVNSDMPLLTWRDNYRDSYLDATLLQEGRGRFSGRSFTCTRKLLTGYLLAFGNWHTLEKPAPNKLSHQ
ncbi:hypothetical protein BD779DRAFT_1480812 [Infundibulicybe gibba]|nr:hypothetical protein BD779DRAFT_1480812 [Infundibulicybe gibba]